MCGEIMISNHLHFTEVDDNDSLLYWAGKVLEPQRKQFFNSRYIYGMQNAQLKSR